MLKTTEDEDMKKKIQREKEQREDIEREKKKKELQDWKVCKCVHQLLYYGCKAVTDCKCIFIFRLEKQNKHDQSWKKLRELK